jgi:hypothetical protein
MGRVCILVCHRLEIVVILKTPMLLLAVAVLVSGSGNAEEPLPTPGSSQVDSLERSRSALGPAEGFYGSTAGDRGSTYGDSLERSRSALGPAEGSYEGSKFTEVWRQVSQTPYTPANRPTRGLSDLVKEIIARNSAGDGKSPREKEARNAELVKRADQTLNDRADYYEEDFTKLVHANGICLKGTWNIDHANPYSGYFAQGKTGLMIARASVAMFNTEKHQTRGFGLAGKIYPAADEAVAGGRNLKTANFFTVHDLGGERNVLFSEVALTNQPPASFNLTVLRFLGYVMQVAKVFKAADLDNGNVDPKPGVRQLYEIAELGLDDAQAREAITPTCMRLKVRAGQTHDKSDFRDELNVAAYADGKLILDIYADSPDPETECGALSAADWSDKQVGYIEFTESVASEGCDKHLHFHHPKWKKAS